MIRNKMFQIAIAISNMFNTKKQGKLPAITEPLLLMPANKLCKMIKEGSLSSLKLCEIFAERIALVQPYVNAMAQSRFDEAYNEARQIDSLLANFRSGKSESEFSSEQLELLDSPLLGVPITIKESIMIKGMRNSCGMWDRRDVIAREDAVIVSNVRRLGMIPICTTNIPECTLYWADCQNAVYGRTLNPYDLARISGSSSGGEGALIASAGSVMGLGSDIAGSLRLPAQYCGIFSHKPSPFLLSAEGNYPALKEPRLRLFTFGPMCRYASDLRPLLKCLLRDKGNAKQDTYYKYQPDGISTLRNNLLQQLDETIDISKIKIFYFDFNKSSELKGRRSVHVQPEFMTAQQELLDHFVSKYNCATEQINLDKYLKKAYITWQCMIRCGGIAERDLCFEEDELLDTFKIDNLAMEFIKMPFGLSKHTKESLLSILVGQAVPRERAKAYPLCERFEQLAEELRQEINQVLGDHGVLIMPTMPTVAYKHNVSLIKTADLRFTALFNILQLPVTHATIRLDKKHKLPFGFSIAARQYNDALTIAIAEEIDPSCGGWVPPTPMSDLLKETNTTNFNNLATSKPQVNKESVSKAS